MTAKMKNFQSIHIGILRYPGAQEASILGLKDLFNIANQLAQKVVEQCLPNVKVSIIDLEDKIDYTDIAFLKSYHPDKDFSAIIIPPDLQGIPSISKDNVYIKFLQCHHQKGTILASVSTGAFLLGETGLLANRVVTTHWKYANSLQKAFPQIHLNINQLLIDDIDIITASGGLSWADLGLCLIKRLLGPIVMADTAKMCLIQPTNKEQRHYSIFEPSFYHGDDAILRVQRWISTTKIRDKITLNKLSVVARLTKRTLQRRFVNATGFNVTEYLQRFRVHQSQIFLQFTRMPIHKIACNVGYKDEGAFTKVFTKIVGLKPSMYRCNFFVIE
ncbi:Transcriptional regulator GlxA [Commensalibacter communis]|uniref:Contains an amidase domain and an AraC-type DNA-binding HTH domain (GlxA) n=2 Tax=Commensalibacter communis TaxID=2972786 RepID=A0A9W4TPY1_9PROT|nr:Transcriptional regulator GlxA [Commensalibacter communis]CAI3958643.1 Transcriptional regulator GlxA [Commensalibacter communis]CAI3959027.1 Transcriptional regulator GlxA [Commensalibacter communis]CAI3959179.1 Transcriptional regulator GlxA [Commensalibacter communis]CAI3960180.1 Transcriptional regulator GlxA [Commensalibacter communis]